jgi:hypothetical protein
MGQPPDAIYSMIRKAGGVRPAPRVRSSRQLSLAEREKLEARIERLAESFLEARDPKR